MSAEPSNDAKRSKKKAAAPVPEASAAATTTNGDTASAVATAEAPATPVKSTPADGGAAEAAASPASPASGVEYLLLSELDERERTSPVKKKRDKHGDALNANRVVGFPIFCVAWFKSAIPPPPAATNTDSDTAAAATPPANGKRTDGGCTTPARVMIGGGGGTSGTGVDSGVALCEVMYDAKSQVPTFRTIGRLDTRDSLVSALHLHPFGTEVAMAVGNRTHLFSIREHATRLLPIGAFQTDFSAKAADQLTSVVRFSSRRGDFLGAAGEDGFVRLWSYPALRPLAVYTPKHNRSVNAMDFSYDETVCVSVGEGERFCRIWRVPPVPESGAALPLKLNDDGTLPPASSDDRKHDYLLKQLTTAEKGKDLEFRSIRFGRAPAPAPAPVAGAQPAAGAPAELPEYLFAVLNADPRGPSYLAKWRVPPASELKGGWTRELITGIDKSSPVTQLELSSDRRRVALTTTENDLYIYDAQTLKFIMKEAAIHDLPCTGMAWSEDNRTILTVSADKTTRFVPVRASARRLSHLLMNLLVVLFCLWAAGLFDRFLPVSPSIGAGTTGARSGTGTGSAASRGTEL